MYVMEAREEVEGTHDQGRLQQLLEESRAQEERCIGVSAPDLACLSSCWVVL